VREGYTWADTVSARGEINFPSILLCFKINVNGWSLAYKLVELPVLFLFMVGTGIVATIFTCLQCTVVWPPDLSVDQK
jgi:hypothetical protein